MLFPFLFSESRGGEICEDATDACEAIFDAILAINVNLNVSYPERTVSV